LIDKTSVFAIIMTVLIVIVAGFTINYQNFNNEGISLQYPANLNEISIPVNDQALALESGFNIIGVFIEGNDIGNYTFFMEIAIADINNSSLKESAESLNKNFILEEADSTPVVTQKTLKNGYEAYVYTYDGTGASSGLKIYEQTYVFTKDNQTAYYITFAAPHNNMEQTMETILNIIDSITIN
jgi:hypothetical protein